METHLIRPAPEEVNTTLKASIAGRTPNMVDAFGTKWFVDPGGSTYATARDQRGIALDQSASVWIIEELNGQCKVCLVIDQRVVFEGYTLEEVARAIEKLRDSKYKLINSGLGFKVQ